MNWISWPLDAIIFVSAKTARDRHETRLACSSSVKTSRAATRGRRRRPRTSSRVRFEAHRLDANVLGNPPSIYGPRQVCDQSFYLDDKAPWIVMRGFMRTWSIHGIVQGPQSREPISCIADDPCLRVGPRHKIDRRTLFAVWPGDVNLPAAFSLLYREDGYLGHGHVVA